MSADDNSNGTNNQRVIIAPDAIVGGAIENIPVEKRGRGNPAWTKGGPSPNPGGRPKALREIQEMLDTEHRNIPKMKETFNRLRELALGESVVVPYVTANGEIQLQAELKADARFMALYLAYVVGPPRAVDADDMPDFTDAPPEVLRYLMSKLARR